MKTSIVTTGPGAPAVSLQNVKQQLRITDDDTTYDAQLVRLIATATRWLERRYGITLTTTTRKQTQDSFYKANSSYRPNNGSFYAHGFSGYYTAPLTLLYPPIQSVTSVKYVDQSGVEQTLTETTDYTVAGTMTPTAGGQDIARVRIIPVTSWPLTKWVPDAIRIVYMAGYGPDASYVPDPIKEAILRTITHLFENPMDEASDLKFMGKFEMGIDSLMSTYEFFEHAGIYD